MSCHCKQNKIILLQKWCLAGRSAGLTHSGRTGIVLGFITDVWAVKKSEELMRSGAETPTSSPGLRLYNIMPDALVRKFLLVLPDPAL